MFRTAVLFLLVIVVVSLVQADYSSEDTKTKRSNSPLSTFRSFLRNLKKYQTKRNTFKSQLNGLKNFLRGRRVVPILVNQIRSNARVRGKLIELLNDIKVPKGLSIFQFNGETAFRPTQPASLFALVRLLTECEIPAKPRTCTSFDRKFRTPDGRCNNLKKKLYGAARTAQIRLIGPAYSDNFNKPRKVPVSPREVSRIFVNGQIKDDKVLRLTDMLKTFGQFVDHDISETPHASGTVCKNCKKENLCFPIRVPDGDTRLNKATNPCLRFGRSFAVCSTGRNSVFFNRLVRREQMNIITAFVDASNVYGSSAKLLNQLRESNSGLLKVLALQPNKHFLPFDRTFPDSCKTAPCVPNFLAGDDRVNENIQLISMHTIFVRYHNNIARKLQKINKHWNKDKVFQETRKIVSAVMQKLVFKDFLPIILGVNGISSCSNYKRSVDPTVSLAFSSAAYRMGHTLIRPIINRLGEDLQPIRQGNINLVDAFFNPKEIFKGGGTDAIMRGLFFTAAKEVDPNKRTFDEVIREQLFANTEQTPPDLIALNIQRARDHGVPSYIKYKSFCRNKYGSSLYAKNPISRKTFIRLLRVYKQKISNIDLFAGGVAEETVSGGLVGPTFHCLIREQFERLQCGDRFYYEHKGNLRPKQVQEIEKVTLAKVICETSDTIARIPPDVFRQSKPRDFVRCSSLPKLRLSLWKQVRPRRG